MKSAYKNCPIPRFFQTPRLRKQKGVVLFIALIVLVAMSLAGISMMRAVDTGTLVAGNLAFRQSASHASDPVGELVISQIFGMTATGASADSASPTAVPGYNHLDVALAPKDRDWSVAQSLPVNSATSNSVQYLIDRLCTPNGPGGSNACSRTMVASDVGNDKGELNPPSLALQHFRAVVRVSDPKGNATYFEFKND